MKKVRQANLELLRIITMLMIVTIHMANHGDLITFAKQGTVSYYIVWILFGMGFGSITIYLLISSYFLIDAKFSLWKIAKMGGQVFFYAFGITALFWTFTDVEHELKTMVFSVLPIASDFYWFVSMYVGMYLLSPILNKLIRAMTKRQLECAMALSFLLVSVWPNIIYYSSALNTAGGVSISWFLTVYLFGAYMKLYYKPDGHFGKKLLWAIGASLLIPLSRFVIEALLQTPLGKISILDDLMWGYSVFFSYSSILSSLSAILWFIAFLNLEIKPGKAANMINKVAGAAFGVYLIHDHLYIRETLWDKVCAYNWLDKWYLLPACIGTVIVIYTVCTLMELLRQKLFTPIDNNEKLRGFFLKIDDKLRKMWRG
ncbi:MAG: acyltransferase [Lachnospiraceae bacterium]|nr:acyltransferase [Lachnospiraceae bacterium]